MKFERGKSVKSTLDIGLIKKLQEEARKAVEESWWEFSSPRYAEDLSKKMSEKVGVPVEVNITQDPDGIWHFDFFISKSVEKIDCKIKLSNGLHYNEDYVENFTDRSLVDKSYFGRKK